MGECFKFGRGKVVLYDPVFANNSWEDIIAACQSGRVPDTWKVGDQKAMTINGTNYPIDIIGINHDTYSDGSGTAPLTFQMHNLYEYSYTMYSVANNTKGWSGCEPRTTGLPKLLTLMPTEVQNGIREVNKLTTGGNQSKTVSATADKLFFLSEVEVFNTTSYSYVAEGSQYAYYATGNSMHKTTNSGSKEEWWLRSPDSYESTTYCYVDDSSKQCQKRDANYSRSISFAFCF